MNINRNIQSQPINAPQQAKAASPAQSAGKAAKTAPTTGGAKNEAAKDIANISTDVQVVGIAGVVGFVDDVAVPGPPVAGALANIIAVEALSNTVNTLPATERMYEAAKQLATAFVNNIKQSA